MPRQIHKLTAVAIAAKKRPSRYPDGGGLYLQVGRSGAKSWLFKFMIAGKGFGMGLGPLHAVSLAEARKRAAECRQLLSDGINPLTARQEQQQATLAVQAAVKTFGECADAFIQMQQPAWKNQKHVNQWTNTLRDYCADLRALPVCDVETSHILEILQPIWSTKRETASRVRGRLERILDWAKVRQYRGGDNPARWRGHLDKLLPVFNKKRLVRHHPAMPYQELPAFMKALRKRPGQAARALELTILTACRTNEVIEGRLPEFDLMKALWQIPASRMKAWVPHVVPLPAPAVEIVRSMEREGNALIFHGVRRKGAQPAPDKPLSNMAMLSLLQQDMGFPQFTVHGFRSTFRDWAAECTNFSREVCEMALAHTILNDTEAAYRRGDLLQKRRALMSAWAGYCDRGAPARVVPLQRPSSR
jgi:integrase